VYGEAIQKHSLQIIFGSHNIIDDGKDNLIDNEINYVGNIFYQQGNIIIINKNSCYSDFINSSNFEITFKGTHAIYEHEIFCTINRNEFNCTLNKSAFDEWNDTSSAAPAMKSKFVNNDA
jgi:hypothetical protein